MKTFFDLLDHDRATIDRLLALARELRDAPQPELLRHKILVLIFMNPSLRTLVSFQAGMTQLGGTSIVVTPGQGSWALETDLGVIMDRDRAEHVREAIPVIEEYADAIGVRSFARQVDLQSDLADPVLTSMAQVAKKPMISMEAATNHPCQALADALTLDDLQIPRGGGKFVLSWAWHPAALPLAVPTAALGMAAQRGMEVVVLRPDGYGLPAPIMERARRAAAANGGSITETTDRRAALGGAHVLYAKSWASPVAYGQKDAEQSLRAPLRAWCVDEPWFAPARRDAIFMHCLPIRRNVVASDAILDGPRSRVIQQAGNRLHAQKAVLATMLGGGMR